MIWFKFYLNFVVFIVLLDILGAEEVELEIKEIREYFFQVFWKLFEIY